MESDMPSKPLQPTVEAVTNFIRSLFPVLACDVPFAYHKPRRRLAPASRVGKVILSITPTPGFYTALVNATEGPTSTLGFLHRPWQLDRSRLPASTTVLACHKAFDEVLTVGFNVLLAERLGLEVRGSRCLKGYGGDEERRIGIVGAVGRDFGWVPFVAKVEGEFGALEGVFGDHGGEGDMVRGVAIMNAFRPEEVGKVAEVMVEMGIATSVERCEGVVYLTGAVRAAGLAAALEKGMRVVCVGHRSCEEWGIRYLAGRLRHAFKGVDVVEVFEEEKNTPSKSTTEGNDNRY